MSIEPFATVIIEGRGYREVHTIPARDVQKFIREKVVVGERYKVELPQGWYWQTDKGEKVTSLEGTKQILTYWHGSKPGEFVHVGYTEMKAVGEGGKIVAQTSPPRLEVTPVVVNEPKPPETQILPNQTQATLPTNISLPVATNFGRQTLSNASKSVQDVVSQITSTPYVPPQEAKRLAEYLKAQEEYWKFKFQENPEKALKEWQEYQKQQEVEKFRTALVTGAGLGFAMALIPPTAFNLVGMASVGYIVNQLREAYRQPKIEYEPVMKNVNGEITFELKEVNKGIKGLEGIKEYFSKPEVQGGLVGFSLAYLAGSQLRPEYTIQLEMPQKLATNTKTIVLNDKAISFTEFYGKTKDVIVGGYEIQKSQLVDQNLIVSKSISKTKVYSPFYGKIWETINFKAPLKTEIIQPTLIGESRIRIEKPDIQQFSRVKLTLDKSTTYLGEDVVGKSTALKLGEGISDNLKYDVYFVRGKSEGVKFFGKQLVIQQLPKKESGASQLGFKATDIPYETLPTEWKISLAMKNIFGEKTGVNTPSQTLVTHSPTIETPKMAVSPTAVSPILVTLPKQEEEIKQELKLEKPIAPAVSAPTQTKISTTNKIIPKIDESVKNAVKLSQPNEIKINLGKPIKEKDLNNMKSDMKQNIETKIKLDVKTTENTQQNLRIVPNITGYAPPNITIKVGKSAAPSLPSLGLLNRMKFKIESTPKNVRPFKIIEKYKPSLFSLHTGLKMKSFGLRGELQKAVFRPIIPKFKTLKFKVKI
jgi:hypothetical protein